MTRRPALPHRLRVLLPGRLFFPDVGVVRHTVDGSEQRKREVLSSALSCTVSASHSADSFGGLSGADSLS